MKWSFSQANIFRKCQRQWYYKYIFASAIAKDPMRKEAHRLSNLTDLKFWRGKIVDAVISNSIIPKMNINVSIKFEEAIRLAREIFDNEKGQGLSGSSNNSNSKFGFVEIEYGHSISEHDFDQAWRDIELCLKNYYSIEMIQKILNKSNYRMTQPNIPIKCNDVSINAKPDIICLYANRKPIIIDWKVQTNPIINSRAQLALYAFALSKYRAISGPLSSLRDLKISELGIAEVQLLAGVIRKHEILDDEVEEIEDQIVFSAEEIKMAKRGLSSKELQASDFKTAYSPSACLYCCFKKICWEVSSELS